MTYTKFLLTRYWWNVGFLVVFSVAAFFLKDWWFTAFVLTVWAVVLTGSWRHYEQCKTNGYF
jgi:uncharacterized membrane protein YccC